MSRDDVVKILGEPSRFGRCPINSAGTIPEEYNWRFEPGSGGWNGDHSVWVSICYSANYRSIVWVAISGVDVRIGKTAIFQGPIHNVLNQLKKQIVGTTFEPSVITTIKDFGLNLHSDHYIPEDERAWDAILKTLEVDLEKFDDAGVPELLLDVLDGKYRPQ